jgi:hypothetical protein
MPVVLARRSLVAGITSLLKNGMFNEDILNITNRRWMERIDNYFILFIVSGGKKVIPPTVQRIKYKSVISVLLLKIGTIVLNHPT